MKAVALVAAAKALTAVDLDRAERIAQSITDEGPANIDALAEVAWAAGSHRPGPRGPAHRRCGNHRRVHHL